MQWNRNGIWIVLTGLAVALLPALHGCEESKNADLQVSHPEELRKVKVVAVMPFVDAPGSPGSGEVVATSIVNQLHKSGVRVVERSRLKAIINEQDLQDALSDDTAAAQVGKIAGADTVFLGELPQYDSQDESGFFNVQGIGGGNTKNIHRVAFNVRAVNTKTGQIIYAEGGGGKSKEGYFDAAKEAATKAMAPWVNFFRNKRGK